jgi:hypothetical protein
MDCYQDIEAETYSATSPFRQRILSAKLGLCTLHSKKCIPDLVYFEMGRALDTLLDEYDYLYQNSLLQNMLEGLPAERQDVTARQLVN